MSAVSTAAVQSALVAAAGTTAASAQAVPCAELANTADPTPEIYEILGARGLSREQVDSLGWYARPKFFEERKGRTEEVDALALMEPLLEEKALVRTVRTMDVLNGCLNQCDTCYADAPLPTTIFSYDSLARLFGDPRFIRMIQSESLRIGSVADLLDHPRGTDIADMILESTLPSEIGVLKLYVNYRRRKEAQFDRLLELAGAHPERLSLTISLPRNRDDSVNRAFDEYRDNRPDIFRAEPLVEGMKVYRTIFKNVGIQDVSRMHLVFMVGRVLADRHLRKRVDSWPPVTDYHFAQYERGLVKTFLNPDALWLKAYVTSYESHTSNAFTPITNFSLSFLQFLKYHYYMKTPPNWPGGSGVKRNRRDTNETRPKKPLTIRE